MTALAKKTRRKLRFAPDPSQHAEIDFNLNRKNFEGELPALIFNESYSGCCVVMMKEKRLKVGGHFKVKVGLLAPLLGEVRWINELDDHFVKLGIEFLE
jgi:hypothetical protein